MCELVITDVCRGFKDARTVELLLLRARRLEHNAVQKNKFNELGQYFLVSLLLFFFCWIYFFLMVCGSWNS